MSNLSKVFKDAKKYLWDGSYYGGGTRFICIAIDRTSSTNHYKETAKEIILERLEDGTVESYLICSLKIPAKEIHGDYTKLQQYRKAWLDELEKEFKINKILYPFVI